MARVLGYGIGNTFGARTFSGKAQPVSTDAIDARTIDLYADDRTLELVADDRTVELVSTSRTIGAQG